MAPAENQGQPTAHNVSVADMKSILPAVGRKEKGIGRRGRTGTGAAGCGDREMRAGGQGQTGKGGKRQVGASGAKIAAGHQEGKGGKRGAHRDSMAATPALL